MQNAEQRELLTRMLDRDKERYRQEDREIEIKMAEQGIRWVGFSNGLLGTMSQVENRYLTSLIPG